MKNITFVCLLSFLLLAGCSKTPKEDVQQAESEAPADAPASLSGEPITLHARLDFTDGLANASINSNRQL